MTIEKAYETLRVGGRSTPERQVARGIAMDALEFLCKLKDHEADLCATINGEWMVSWFTDTEQRKVYGDTIPAVVTAAIEEWDKE